MKSPIPQSNATNLWMLDPKIKFLNHGSFGACPVPVLKKQQSYRVQLEAEPVRFMMRELDALLERSRTALSQFVGCNPEDLVFVTNATTAVNTVLRSLELEPGDEILITDNTYPACRNAVHFIAGQKKAQVTEVKLQFPVTSDNEIAQAILNSVTPKTRFALIDHVSSFPGIIFPVRQIASQLSVRGVELMIDGAHAPGMIPLNIEDLNVPYFTGNCHKWMCAPKGAAFLYVRKDRQHLVRPLVMSHGYRKSPRHVSQLQTEFAWNGTHDPSPFICIADAIEFMGTILPGGWGELMKRNHELAVNAGKLISRALDLPYPLCPEKMIGSMYAIPVPDATETGPFAENYIGPLQNTLFYKHNIEVPVSFFPKPPRRFLRISAQAYNSIEQYEELAEALREIIRILHQ